VCLFAGLLAVAAGSLRASNTLSLTCSLTVTGLALPGGVTGSNGCFQTSFINANVWDSLNWGAPTSAVGPSGLGAATVGNSFNASSGPVATRTATQGNNQVAVQLAPGYLGTATSVTRVDDLALEFNGVTWVSAASVAPAVASFAGHFNSASANSPSSTGNDHLLELSNGGPLELTLLGAPAYGMWFQIAALGTSKNTLFVAQVQAFDSSGAPIGSYQLTESGSYGSGGICSALNANSPTPCADAPYVGFYDPEGRIKSIYVSVFNPGNLTSPIGFAIDSLLLSEVPEPAMLLMIGGGLAAIALYGRKRRARSG
jgi:hypothetical protein